MSRDYHTVEILLPVLAAFQPAGAPAVAGNCNAPDFSVEIVKMGDGSLDRGFPGGVSLADADGDGDLDIMVTRGYDVTSSEHPPRPDRDMLYLNDGHGSFASKQQSPLSQGETYSSGSSWADIDADGDLDVFVSTQRGQQDLFFRNFGKGRFERQMLGDATHTGSDSFSNSWADIDQDGDLDLYVGGPTLSKSAPNKTYRNDGGRFVQVSGLKISNGESNAGAVVWADFDNDGATDLVVANSDIARLSGRKPAANEDAVLFRNEGSWQFTRRSEQEFQNTPSTSIAVGDVDLDGDLDLFLGAYADSRSGPRADRLFLNDGKSRFLESTNFPGAKHGKMSGGASFGDFDLDGDLDLITASAGEGIELYLNDGSGRFARSGNSALLARRRAHSGVATGDIDGDRDLDVVIGYWGMDPGGDFVTILRNDTHPCGDWSEVQLVTRNGAPNPPGSRVSLISEDEDGRRRLQLREASAQTGFRSQSASFFLFGIPKTERILSAEIRWPDGSRQTLARVPRNSRIVVRAE